MPFPSHRSAIAGGRSHDFAFWCLVGYDGVDNDDTYELVILNLIFGLLALLSLTLTLWQWLAGCRFPLHQRNPAAPLPDPAPSLTLLKPLKGCDAATENCLRSWFTQGYAGTVQLLFGVAEPEDPVCQIVRKLIQEFPGHDAELFVCGPPRGANAKVSQLIELERRAKHELLVISDADVLAPPDLLVNLVAPFWGPARSQEAGCGVAQTSKSAVSPTSKSAGPSLAAQVGKPAIQQTWKSALPTGLACCFYRLANPTTLAMQWEAIAINADFWSQVLQAKGLKPIDFALGAVMAVPRQQLQEIGGLAALSDCLADDYQLGNRIARRGHSIGLSPVVVECWSAPMGWAAVWKHQLRWARTIRVCQPAPYFFSLLSNATLWPLLWLIVQRTAPVCALALGCVVFRVMTALDLERRMIQAPARWAYAWVVPLKDLFQAAIWLLAFLGNRVEWRGERMRLRADGMLESLAPEPPGRREDIPVRSERP